MRARTVFVVFLAITLAALVQAGGWYFASHTIAPPDVRAVESVSFSPYTRDQNPTKGAAPTAETIARDLEVVTRTARGIRTYAVTGGLEQVPLLAQRYRKFRVTLGLWVDRDEARTQREIESAVKIANHNKNVVAVVVGNETLLRQDRKPEELVALIKNVRQKVKDNTLVTTSETWDIWLKHPELAEAVDYISVHILPYWEGIAAEKAVAYTFSRYDELQRAYPDKTIVIGEFGWPSDGYNRQDAKTGPLIQAQVIRDFIAGAIERDIDYNIIEAFDQPWKTGEGSVGAYWGLFDAERHPKFSLDGLVKTKGLLNKAAAGLLLGAAIAIFGLSRRRPTLGHGTAYALAANAMAAGIVSALWWPFEAYMNAGTYVMWGIGVFAILPLTAITLAKVHELAEVILGHPPERLLHPGAAHLVANPPLVSIQIPAYKEQPEMLKATMDAVAALDYPNFEALVIVNNTPDEAYWRPIEAHCQALGPRFKFVFLPKVAGFKAGALNEAMKVVDANAEILALIDADYVVDPHWLRDLVPAFGDANVALVQAPQDHRDGRESVLKRMMNWEYAGFFDIGMIQRNEDDAIVAHGTMLMVRRSAFEAVGGWQTDTIVEDTELGLRLFEAGFAAHYTNVRYGWGILPDTFKAFKTQRHRWAYGAIQIIKKHWRFMLPRVGALTPEQKFQYTTGWFYWLSDALGVLVAVLNLAWVPLVLGLDMMVPTVAMTLPILTAFAVNVTHAVLLYRVRVKATLADTLAGAVAAMSLQLTVAKAVFDGFVKDGIAFKVTAKGGAAKARSGESVALWESILGFLLLAAAAALTLRNVEKVVEINLFAVTLAIQAVPFLAATFMRMVELSGRKG
ncbi:MAG: glycosyltransferase [Alphaproteobacteria bacterium]|nr:glycosyltransferase [Alphaproteobacteria bacterium]